MSDAIANNLLIPTAELTSIVIIYVKFILTDVHSGYGYQKSLVYIYAYVHMHTFSIYKQYIDSYLV